VARSGYRAYIIAVLVVSKGEKSEAESESGKQKQEKQQRELLLLSALVFGAVVAIVHCRHGYVL